MHVFRCPLRFPRLTPILVSILAVSVLAPNAHAQKHPVGDTKIGRIAPMSPGGAVPGSETLSVTLLPQVQTFIDAWAEYNPSTCTEISPGSWMVTTAPKYGTTATGTVTGTLGNGDCPGVTFTFAAIYYSWTTKNQKVDTDTFAATWASPDYQEMDTVDITECGAPTIMFNGTNIAGKTTSVAVGQEIMLTGQAPNAACVSATVSQQWSSPPTKNAVGGYTPTTTSYATAAVTPLPSDTTTTSYGPFYWISPGKYTMTYQYTVSINGASGSSPVSTAKFTVEGPTDVSLLICGGDIDEAGGADCTGNGPLGKVAIVADSLYFGGTTGNVGIAMTASASAPPGNFTWVQLITNDVLTKTPSAGGAVQTCYPAEVPVPGVFPGLDTAYTYPVVNSAGTTAYDNPSTGLSGYKKVSRAFSAQMNLMWTPTASAGCTGDTCTIPVPLGHVNWKVSATATLNKEGTWVPSGSGSANKFAASRSYPTWTSWVTYSGSDVCH